jgi:hypothetical protein
MPARIVTHVDRATEPRIVEVPRAGMTASNHAAAIAPRHLLGVWVSQVCAGARAVGHGRRRIRDHGGYHAVTDSLTAIGRSIHWAALWTSRSSRARLVWRR